MFTTTREYKKMVGIVYRVPRKEPEKHRPDRPDSISGASAAALWAWWGVARETGKLLCGYPVIEKHCYGGTEDWPDWASGESIRDAVAKTTGVLVSLGEVSSWMRGIGAKKKTRDYFELIARQKVHKSRVVYDMSVFRKRYIDRG